MKRITQTIFGNGKGNCFAACVASILELPLEEVPNLCDRDLPGGDKTWVDRWAGWLRGLGVSILYVNLEQTGTLYFKALGRVYCIGSGRSPRAKSSEDDFLHACVFRLGDGVLHPVHDPHPSQDYITGELQGLILLIPVYHAAVAQPEEQPICNRPTEKS